jgi:hypothetical protein
MQFVLYKDPANPERYSLALISIIFICISWPFILLRLYVRGSLVKSLGKDDFFAFLGQVRPTFIQTGLFLDSDDTYDTTFLDCLYRVLRGRHRL